MAAEAPVCNIISVRQTSILVLEDNSSLILHNYNDNNKSLYVSP